MSLTSEVAARKARIARQGLHTICESGRCPNLSECFRAGNATFLIMGSVCTRDCGFCAVQHGKASPLDPGEGRAIAREMAAMSIRYAVITSVTRDDLPDGGASHFAGVVHDVRAVLPSLRLELLTPDFGGNAEAVESVAALPIEVFAHNLETVEALYPLVRRGADYARSLDVLRRARRAGGAMIKSGIMVGLGETSDELARVFDDLAAAGVGIVTIGQYLQPGRKNVPVARYLCPEEFETLAQQARGRGIPVAHSGPFVRSSYLAEGLYRPGTREKDLTRGTPGNIISDETDT